MRIDNLEREYDQLIARMHDQKSTPVNQGIEVSQMGPAFELQEKLEHSERRC